MDKIEKIRAEIKRLITDPTLCSTTERKIGGHTALLKLVSFIDSLQQEQQMPDSTQLIAEWEREKAVLEQKDFRGDAEQMAYNAFLDGFVKGLGYEGTK